MDLLGKKAKELQTGVVVDGETITGTLKYVTGYTGFNSADVSEQSGHYLALKFATAPEAEEVTVELVGGVKGPVALDEDMMYVGLITEKINSIRVVATSGEKTATKEFDIAGLILE